MVGSIVLTGAVGVILDECFNRAEGLIDKATTSANIVALTAGSELRNAIEKVRVAYREELDHTIDEVNKAVKDRITQLAALAEQVQKQTDAQLKMVAKDAQLVANLLPFSNERPLLTNVSPRFVIIKNNNPKQPLFFKFQGNFVHAATLPPTLTFNGCQATLTHNTVNQLEFKILAKDAFDMTAFSKAKTYSFITGELKTAWPGPNSLPSLTSFIGSVCSAVLGSSTPNPIETFKITIGALPPSPGTIRLKYATLKKAKKEEWHQSGNKHVDSCKEGPHHRQNESVGGHNRDESMFFTEDAPLGWTIKPGTVTNTEILAPHNGVNTKLTFISHDENKATFLAETEWSANHSGIMDFCIKFIKWRDILVKDQDFDDPIWLGWGKEHTFVPLHNWDKWKVVFKPFDSAVDEEFDKCVDHDRIKIANSPSGGFTITAKIPEELDDD